MNTKMKYIYGLFFILFTFVACDETFEEVNANKNSPEDVTINLLLPTIQSRIFGSLSRDVGQSGGVFTQHFAGNHGTGIEEDQYRLDAGSFDFTGTYSASLMEAKVMIEKASASEDHPDNQYIGVGKIMQAIALGYTTDFFGDIPWSEALLGGASAGNPYPKYDTQESIYTVIQTLLDEAVLELSKPLSGLAVGDDDLMYGGDMESWIVMAHVLKARYHNHLSKLDPAGSAASAIASIDAAITAGLVASLNMAYRYDGGRHQNPWNFLWKNTTIIASENFMNALIAENDPRLEAYWDDVAFGGGAVGYTGKPNGQGVSTISYSPVGPNGFFGKDTSPLLIATYFEAKFIEAEAALRAGNTTRAAAAHNAGVAASIDLVVSDAAGLARVPGYITTFGSEIAASITLSKIMTEKHKAMFTQGGEAWVDMRRHDYAYPSYIAIPLNAVPGGFIRRVLYPQIELEYNTSTPLGITQFDRLWWDKE